jgi:hypothetical protein
MSFVSYEKLEAERFIRLAAQDLVKHNNVNNQIIPD